MGSFYGGYGEMPPQPCGWQRPDACRFINNAREGGHVTALRRSTYALVTIIALGLIWLGAARIPASAKSRYVTAGVLSAALIGWVAVAQYLGAANTYFA